MKIQEKIKKEYTVNLNDGEYKLIQENGCIQIFKKISKDVFSKKLKQFAEIQLKNEKELKEKREKEFKSLDKKKTSARPKEECIVPTKELIELYTTLELSLPTDIYCKDKTLKDSQ